MKKEENILGYEKISKLMKKFSIPCIISLVVNSLYNIVDQIFIGWGVGYLGNGATNVVFPLTMICLAFSLMFGDGASAYLSLKLGEKKKKEAAQGVVNGFILSVIVSILFFVGSSLFLKKLIYIFGCTKKLEIYALEYGGSIVIGLPFMMIGTTLNSIIRADSSPAYAMKTMILGAVLNIILDPIFIFVFHMGVRGAAIATVISQFVTFILNILYLKKFKSIKLSKKKFKFDKSVALKVSTLGISSFITQISIVLVIAFENNLLSKYGAHSKYGAEIPITVLGIVMKINQILNSFIIGIAAGSQPIVGYNYGAGKYDRVKETLKRVLTLSVVVGTIGFLLFQLIPDKLIMIFGSGNKLYMDFASYAFRVYLMLCIINGIQIASGIFFQAIGKSAKSAFISLSRQILFLIPAMIVLGKLYGVEGILYAGPFADLLAFIISTILLLFEVKKLNSVKSVRYDTKVSTLENNSILDKNIVITISREYGSGGRYIAKLVAEKLKIKLYDKDFIKELTNETGLDSSYIENIEQKRTLLDNFNSGYYQSLSNADELFLEEANLIKKLASKNSCVIVGRCADFILKDNKNLIKIFIYSDMESKIKRAIKYYNIPKKDAKKEIEKINKLRKNHYKYYTNREWNNPENYDLCLNSDSLGVEKCAEVIEQYVIGKKDKN